MPIGILRITAAAALIKEAICVLPPQKIIEGGFMIRAIAMFVLLCVFASLQEMPGTLHAATRECTRAGLQSAAAQYVQARKAGNASLMPLAAQARYIENRTAPPRRAQDREHP